MKNRENVGGNVGGMDSVQGRVAGPSYSEAENLLLASGPIKPLKKIILQIKTNAPIELIREDYQHVAETWLKVSKLNHEQGIIQKIQSVKNKLDTAKLDTANVSHKELLAELEELASLFPQQLVLLIQKLLENEISLENLAESPSWSHLSHFEFLLKTFSPISDQDITLLKEHGVMNENDFNRSDPLDLANTLDMPFGRILELKAIFQEYGQLKEKRELGFKVLEMHKINMELTKEIENLSSANNILIEGNKGLRNKSDQIYPQYLEKIQLMRDLQNKITTAQIESNRLAMEIAFLKEERTKLSSQAEEKHLSLGKILRRIETVKKSYDFIKGETTFSQDLLDHLDSLLGDALKCGRVLGDKLDDTERSLESALSEISETIKKGKTIFYQK
ncbi:MAG: hypothetical protein HQK53_02610 [Oligoflexia bacterium]|nr:hypothetical protein [Oligoflexia bacterium]